MLGHWFQGGLGQILAPDDKIASVPQEAEGSAGIWSILAPDPAWEASQHGTTKKKDGEAAGATSPGLKRQKSNPPPPEAFDLASPKATMPEEVLCQHCFHMTPVNVAPSTPNTNSANQLLKSPLPLDIMSPLEKAVITAARDTAFAFSTSNQDAESRNKVFRICGTNKQLDPRVVTKLRKMFADDPKLLSCRASNMGNLVPDGLTPLMAAAFCNQVDAAKLILQLDKDAITKTHVDLQGRTALHIASEMGSVDVVGLLQSNDTLGPSAPVDLIGHTPLGRAVTSHQKSARRKQVQLTAALFSPGDKSVVGNRSPVKERASSVKMGKHSSTLATATFGYSQMNGYRVTMEDALSLHTWKGHLLVGVCDGHGDNAEVSSLVAEHVKDMYHKTAEQLPMDQRWIHTFLALDQKVKDSRRKGGSTGLWALVTETTVVTVNVGDCRCILIQQEEQEENQLEKKLAEMTIEEGVEETKEEPPEAEKGLKETKAEATSLTPPAPVPGTEGEVEFTNSGMETYETTMASAATRAKTRYVVTALTTDHKPDLAWEQARVEKAGLSVVKETFYDDHGVKQTISKILLSEGNKMAVSRAFGDFEYKANNRLAPEDQAVCVIPEVRTHERSNKDMYLVLACDGIWDVMSNDQVGNFVVQEAERLMAADEDFVLPIVGDALLAECLNLGSKDNMSVVIVALSGGVAVKMSGVSPKTLFE